MRPNTQAALDWLHANEERFKNCFSLLTKKDINKLLDDRDKNPFDSDWVNANKELQRIKNGLNPDESEHLVVKSTELGMHFFVMSAKITKSNDLAGYVSDDFHLIFESLSCKIESLFIYSLLNAYLNGTIPSNKMVACTHNPSNLY